MTSDQIYLREGDGARKERETGFFGNSVHLTFMPIKQSGLESREREAESREGALNDRWVRRESAHRKKKEGELKSFCCSVACIKTEIPSS